MVAKNQQASLDKVLVHEGGYVNHPDDPGGPTNKGVTQRVYDDYREGRGLPRRSVKKITAAEVFEVYDRRYWDLIKGDHLPIGVDYVVFDGAVNSGVSQSAKWLQRALGSRYAGKVDGIIGPTTLDAVRDHPDHDALIAAICARRMAFLKALKTWKTFGKGWTRRVNGVKEIGQAWATGEEAPAAEYVPNGNAKAPIESAKPAPSKAPGDGATGAGGITVVIMQTIDQLKSLGESPLINNAVVILTLAGAVVTIGGLAYRWYATRKTKELQDALDLVPA